MSTILFSYDCRTQDDIIEDEVAQIWIPTEGDYAQDLEYADKYGNGGGLGISSFAAMAISRDGENIFTEARLEEIRARMEVMENTTVRNSLLLRAVCLSMVKKNFGKRLFSPAPTAFSDNFC